MILQDLIGLIEVKGTDPKIAGYLRNIIWANHLKQLRLTREARAFRTKAARTIFI